MDGFADFDFWEVRGGNLISYITACYSQTQTQRAPPEPEPVNSRGSYSRTSGRVGNDGIQRDRHSPFVHLCLLDWFFGGKVDGERSPFNLYLSLTPERPHVSEIGSAVNPLSYPFGIF